MDDCIRRFSVVLPCALALAGCQVPLGAPPSETVPIGMPLSPPYHPVAARMSANAHAEDGAEAAGDAEEQPAAPPAPLDPVGWSDLRADLLEPEPDARSRRDVAISDDPLPRSPIITGSRPATQTAARGDAEAHRAVRPADHRESPKLTPPNPPANVIRSRRDWSTVSTRGQQPEGSDDQAAPLVAPPAPADDAARIVPPAPDSPTGDASGDMADNTGPTERFPIDLPTVLRLAGAENWSVVLAAEQIREAQAVYDQARVLWVPSVNGGLVYTKHDGKIQETEGDVIDVSRNALFLGGGPAVGGAPLTGASGGPARMFVDLSLADAIFEPLAARRFVSAAEAAHCATFNNVLLEASVAYFELVDAYAGLEIARRNLADANELLTLTTAFVEAGKGSQADVARAKVEATNRDQAAVDAELAVKVASAELARILQLDTSDLDPRTMLFPLDGRPLPIDLVEDDAGLPELIAQAHQTRPELAEVQWRLSADEQRVNQERWRPWIPNVHVGTSVGGFGGGVNDSLTGLDGRSDVDLLAVWQLRNLGLGNHAARRERSSQYRQTLVEHFSLRDLIATEVTTSYHQTSRWRQQIDLARENLSQAADSYSRDLARINVLVGLPLESLQSLQALAEARREYVLAVTRYNQSQVRLLRSLGLPPEANAGMARADLN